MEDRFQQLLEKAIQMNATDIHLDNDGNKVTIGFRVNGNILAIESLKDDSKLFSYLMYLANLDLTNQIKPKTGNFEYVLENIRLSLRIAYMKSFLTTSCVIRILNHQLNLNIDNLSKDINDVNYFKKIKKLKNGLVLISGPTGSGKTTSLYTLLNSMSEKKIFTIEDPIEVYSDKIVQLAVNESIGLNYEACLKQLLRHDPDLIVIGEIRDENTANIALKAAITGHLVLATIHAFNSVTTILRMVDLKVNELMLQDILKGIISQRIIENNKEKYAIFEICDDKELEYYFRHKAFRKSFRNNPLF